MRIVIILTLVFSSIAFSKKKKDVKFLRKNIQLTKGSKLQLNKYLKENKRNKQVSKISMLCTPTKNSVKCDFAGIKYMDMKKSFEAKMSDEVETMMKRKAKKQ